MSGFDFRTSKKGQVFISHDGRDVTTLRGDAAARFLDRVREADDEVVQLEMARVTGNYKRGNER